MNPRKRNYDIGKNNSFTENKNTSQKASKVKITG